MLKLPHTIAAELARHAEREYPEECCGVLLGSVAGDTRTVVEARACVNTRAEERGRYAIAPAELIAAPREARARGLAIVGFYHSHPDHPAAPSATDRDEACWPECSYVIVSAGQGHAGEMRSFVVRNGALVAEELG
jgi:proteasome lid subunit RPN8/RPN11